jgi:hypothetical protein
MSSQHSEMLDKQLIPAEAEQRFVRIGELGRKVLHGNERLLIAAGLICVLVYVCTRIYATAKTASQLPLIGMLGVLALLSGLALRELEPRNESRWYGR